MENGNKIGPKEMINYLNENNIDIYCLLCNFSMLDCILGTLSELEIEQIEKNIGEIESVYQSEEKEDEALLKT